MYEWLCTDRRRLEDYRKINTFTISAFLTRVSIRIRSVCIKHTYTGDFANGFFIELSSVSEHACLPTWMYAMRRLSVPLLLIGFHPLILWTCRLYLYVPSMSLPSLPSPPKSNRIRFYRTQSNLYTILLCVQIQISRHIPISRVNILHTLLPPHITSTNIAYACTLDWSVLYGKN